VCVFFIAVVITKPIAVDYEAFRCKTSVCYVEERAERVPIIPPRRRRITTERKQKLQRTARGEEHFSNDRVVIHLSINTRTSVCIYLYTHV